MCDGHMKCEKCGLRDVFSFEHDAPPDAVPPGYRVKRKLALGERMKANEYHFFPSTGIISPPISREQYYTNGHATIAYEIYEVEPLNCTLCGHQWHMTGKVCRMVAVDFNSWRTLSASCECHGTERRRVRP